MIKIEDHCVDCPPELGCLGDACPYLHEKHYYCDECDEEWDPGDMIEIDGKMICPDCLHDYLVRHHYGNNITE